MSRNQSKELIRSDPNNGPANLGLAQIAAQQGNVKNAVENYHKAIYGSWVENAQDNRMQARMNSWRLWASSAKTQAQAELLLLLDEMPEHAALQKQIGRLLLDYELVKESADVFRGDHSENAPGWRWLCRPGPGGIYFGRFPFGAAGVQKCLAQKSRRCCIEETA